MKLKNLALKTASKKEFDNKKGSFRLKECSLI